MAFKSKSVVKGTEEREVEQNGMMLRAQPVSAGGACRVYTWNLALFDAQLDISYGDASSLLSYLRT